MPLAQQLLQLVAVLDSQTLQQLQHSLGELHRAGTEPRTALSVVFPASNLALMLRSMATVRPDLSSP